MTERLLLHVTWPITRHETIQFSGRGGTRRDDRSCRDRPQGRWEPAARNVMQIPARDKGPARNVANCDPIVYLCAAFESTTGQWFRTGTTATSTANAFDIVPVSTDMLDVISSYHSEA
ncbi:unnamed protein product [Notodromas monacha]|uniref:Uncharacterized protein n=1 Tax=Notodromas monacha TaxID=399045 RepID=A0A7R9G962_9CRUS|nr:unnamed protein product [Notodromas monacha]CAG0912277.1 unnamed protein product [Notodromas monacha]